MANIIQAFTATPKARTMARIVVVLILLWPAIGRSQKDPKSAPKDDPLSDPPHVQLMSILIERTSISETPEISADKAKKLNKILTQASVRLEPLIGRTSSDPAQRAEPDVAADEIYKSMSQGIEDVLTAEEAVKLAERNLLIHNAFRALLLIDSNDSVPPLPEANVADKYLNHLQDRVHLTEAQMQKMRPPLVDLVKHLRQAAALPSLEQMKDVPQSTTRTLKVRATFRSMMTDSQRKKV